MVPNPNEVERVVVGLDYEEALRSDAGDAPQAYIHEATVDLAGGGSATRQRAIRYVQGCQHPGPPADLCICGATCCAKCVCETCGRGVCRRCALRSSDGQLFCTPCGAFLVATQRETEAQSRWLLVLGVLGIVSE